MRDRASVLHDAADELERLRAQLAEVRAREQRRRAEVVAVFAALGHLDAVTARSLYHCPSSLSLARSPSSRLCVALISDTSGERVLSDVSEAVAESTGWQRQRLLSSPSIGRMGGPPVPADLACPLFIRYEPTQSAQATTSPKHLQQYPASKRALVALFAGEQRKAELTFRMWTADGRVVEAECTVWQMHWGEASGEGSAQQPHGDRRQRHVALTWAMDDCLEVPALCVAPTV